MVAFGARGPHLDGHGEVAEPGLVAKGQPVVGAVVFVLPAAVAQVLAVEAQLRRRRVQRPHPPPAEGHDVRVRLRPGLVAVASVEAEGAAVTVREVGADLSREPVGRTGGGAEVREQAESRHLLDCRLGLGADGLRELPVPEIDVDLVPRPGDGKRSRQQKQQHTHGAEPAARHHHATL